MVQYEFGFALNLGARGSRKATGLAHHGFALVQDEFSGVGPRAIEYFNVFASLPVTDANRQTERLTFGNWLVEVDDAVQLEVAYNRSAREQRAPLFADYTMWDILTRGQRDG